MPLRCGHPLLGADVATSDGEPQRTEKTMSLAPHEFVMGCERLAAENDSVSEARAELALGEGRVVVTYEPLPSVRLGGLLELPRAKVALAFEGVSAEDQEAFVRRFEITFQRGGG